jgi:hypothetical protein
LKSIWKDGTRAVAFEPHDLLVRRAGNQTRAAKMLGISCRQLIGRIEHWNLPRPKKR